MSDPGIPILPWFIGVAAGSWLLVGLVRRYALARGVLDRPRERSSHVVPTPRGGGAGLVIAAIVGYLAAAPTNSIDWRLTVALAGVFPTAVVGWFDDHGDLPIWPRVSAHLVSGLMILPLAVESSNRLPGMAVMLSVAWVLATLSAINVVNFMDGIDGLIGLQGLVFSAHLVVLSETGSAHWLLAAAVAAASVGFLVWNWSPARVFLGDVGSGGLAMLGLIGGLLVWKTGTWPFVAIFLPLFPIFLDATATIARRARRGERLTAAHRSHLYQRLVSDAKWTHARVTILYGALSALASAVVLVASRSSPAPAIASYAILTVALGLLLERLARSKATASKAPA